MLFRPSFNTSLACGAAVAESNFRVTDIVLRITIAELLVFGFGQAAVSDYRVPPLSRRALISWYGKQPP